MIRLTFTPPTHSLSLRSFSNTNSVIIAVKRHATRGKSLVADSETRAIFMAEAEPEVLAEVMEITSSAFSDSLSRVIHMTAFIPLSDK